MNTSSASPTSATSDIAPTDTQHLSVLWGWCLQREAGRFLPQMALAAPLIVLEFCCWMFWPSYWYPNQGRDLLHVLVGLAAMMILGGGAVHAAQAICWEVSPELRELVRLTGIGPVMLLGCKSVARWSTIGCSLMLLIPLVCFAQTLGGVTMAQLWAYGWILLMLAVLTAGLALFAGISSTETQNASTTAAMATFLLLLLYHLMFWLSTIALLLANWCVTGAWGFPFDSWWRTIHNFAWQSAPITVLIRAGMAPESFTPLSPSYWIHFVFACYIVRMASVIMISRFRSIRSPGDVDSESTNGRTSSRGPERPRCTDAPHFWKDAHILSGGIRSQRQWNVTYGAMALGILVVGLTYRNGELPMAVGIIAECTWPVIFAVRMEALLASEFKNQTWQGLMLLPINRRILLWAKLRAVAWEQRAAALPVLIAITFAFPRNPIALFMTGTIATLAGMLMCQASAINYLSTRHWLTGPLQIAGILISIAFCVLLWVAFGVWPGFFLTTALMAIAIVIIQSVIDDKLRNWAET